MKKELEGLFNLPIEEKKKLWQEPGSIEGFGQHFVVSEKQKLEWADFFFLKTLPFHLRNPHFFSAFPPPFRETLEAYSEEMRNLAKKILEQMGKALGMDFINEIKEYYEEGWQSMKMNYYPPCPQPELAMGLSPHSDVGGLTILLQVNEIEGLQMRKEGLWIPVKPLPDAFIINIGDCLEIMTNGIYIRIEHRATVNSNKERPSIAAFYSPRMDGNIGPAPNHITSETSAKFRTMSFADYYKGYFAHELNGKWYLEVVKIHYQADEKSLND